MCKTFLWFDQETILLSLQNDWGNNQKWVAQQFLEERKQEINNTKAIYSINMLSIRKKLIRILVKRISKFKWGNKSLIVLNIFFNYKRKLSAGMTTKGIKIEKSCALFFPKVVYIFLIKISRSTSNRIKVLLKILEKQLGQTNRHMNCLI